MQHQHAVSVALHMLLNNFFKLYDLNGDDCTENDFHLFFCSTEYCFDVLKELTVEIKTARYSL